MKQTRFISVCIAGVLITSSVPFPTFAAIVQTEPDWAVAYESILFRCSNSLYFDLYDIDNNGIPELFITETGTRGTNNISIFSYSSGTAFPIKTLYASALCAVPTTGELLCIYQPMGSEETRMIYKYDGTTLSESNANSYAASYDPYTNSMPMIGSSCRISARTDNYWRRAISAAMHYDNWKAAYTNILDTAYYFSNSDPVAGMMYQILDLNGDNQPELLLSDGGYNASNLFCYTYVSGRVALIKTISGSSGSVYYNAVNGYLTAVGNFDSATVFQMEGAIIYTLHQFTTNNMTGNYIDGEPVTEEQYHEEKQKYLSNAVSIGRKNTHSIGNNLITDKQYSTISYPITGKTQALSWQQAYIGYLNSMSLARNYEDQSYVAGMPTNYSLIDFDQNGIPELVTADKRDNYYINDQPQVYTYSNGQILQVSEKVDSSKFGPGWWSIYSPSLYANTNNGYYYCNYESQMLFFKYNGINFILESIFQKWDNEYKYNGYSTTKSNYEQQLQKFQSVIENGFKVNYDYDITDATPILNYKKSNPPATTTTTSATSTTTTSTTTTTTTTSTTLTTTTTELPQQVEGDLNGDKMVSVADTVLMARFLAEALTPEEMPAEDALTAADLDKDGILTMVDIKQLLKLIT